MSTCPVCSQEAPHEGHGDSVLVECQRCGRYGISRTAQVELESRPLSDNECGVVSGWIAENHPELLSASDIGRLRALRAPSVGARADRLLTVLVRSSKSIGGSVNTRKAVGKYLAASYSKNEGELAYLVNHLQRRGFVDLAPGDSVSPVVSPAGYDHYETQIATNAASPIGFCAMWFDETVLSLWTETIFPAVTNAGYEPQRMDLAEHNNRIDDEIVARIRRSRFLVADLTGHRQSVYFEAGLAAGLGLQVIYMVREDQLESVHFDNRQYPFIVWKADKLSEAAKRLQDRIEATIGRGPRASGL